MPNPNTVFANTFVDALISAGLDRVCLVPGSRHTALILALARHRDAIAIYSHLDERSAAFFALGMAMASNEPVALVCTSGSAAANFFPAIVEAHQSRLPLLVLTADRPHELRQSGANQTIDQVKLYGDYVEWFYDAPLPEPDAPALALRNLRSLAARALAKTERGVVHINLPFRKPFEPSDNDADALRIDRREPTRYARQHQHSAQDPLGHLHEEVFNKTGIIYFGHGASRSENETKVLQPWAASLSRRSGFPILAEFTSNMRDSSSDDGQRYQPLGAYESYISSGVVDLESIEVLIRFGAPPLSRNMQVALEQANLQHYLYCSRTGEWADDSHQITDLLVFDPATAAAYSMDSDLPQAENSAFRDRLNCIDAAAWQIISDEIGTGAYFDGAVLHDAVDLMPHGGTIFAGNSLPVRHLDQFAKPAGKQILAFANRGASGIDGNISTALGTGAVRAGRPLVAIVGDITFYHDMNGLLAVQRCGIPVTIVLLNNDGGGIFHRLPIHSFEPHFSDYFITAHGLDFAHAARIYGLEYCRADDRRSFRQAFSESVAGRNSTIIEVRTDAKMDLQRREEIMSAVHSGLKSMHI